MSFSEKLLLLFFSAVALIVVAESHMKTSLEEEDNEVERLLKYINKPAIKSFQTEHGDILDCIDIHKQLAFDHPLLKNHSVQLRPTTEPKWTINNNNSQGSGSLPFQQDGITCPLGTVIVKRTTHEDLIQSQRLKSMGLKNSRYVSSKGENIDLTGFHFAVGEYKYYHYGAKGNLNLWEPKVSPTQFSSASMLIAGGSKEQFQAIRAGWIISQDLVFSFAFSEFHSSVFIFLQVYQWLTKNHSRLYTYWTADGFTKTGCYNTLCPGFVQVSTKIPLGFLLQPVSRYGGQQYEIDVSMYQDKITGDWWLVVLDEQVGYWPKSLFIKEGLGHGASIASWGGEVYSPVKEKSPGMGSGHFPKEGYVQAAYVNGIEVVHDFGGTSARPEIFTIEPYSSTPNCYRAVKKPGLSEVWYDAIFYGGPGGCIF